MNKYHIISYVWGVDYVFQKLFSFPETLED